VTFCYFVPDWRLNVINSVMDIPEATGLRKVLRGRLRTTDGGFSARVGVGPGGREGTMFVAAPAAGSGGEAFDPVCYDAACVKDEGTGLWQSDTQRWHEVKNPDDTTNHFIGWNVAAIPGPNDLARLNQVAGHPVALADGREWLIPVVGPFLSKLPMSFRVNAKGEMAQQVRKEFAAIFRQSEVIFDKYLGDRTGVPRVDCWRFAADVLAINYRVGLTEISGDVLDLVTTENFTAIFEVACGEVDYRLADESKKNMESEPPAG